MERTGILPNRRTERGCRRDEGTAGEAVSEGRRRANGSDETFKRRRNLAHDSDRASTAGPDPGCHERLGETGPPSDHAPPRRDHVTSTIRSVTVSHLA